MTSQDPASGRAHWQTRSKAWLSTAAEGRSVDDTFNQLLIKQADIRPNHRVLDLGSGTGDPAVSIGIALSGKGFIVASDMTPEMLAAARRRSVNLEIGTMAFAGADMQTLPFRDESFDRVTCRFGLMFVEDRVAAASEALRVLKPHGRVAYIVWGPYDENPPFHIFRRTVAASLGRDEGLPPRRHCLGMPGQLAEILEAAGCQEVEDRALKYRRVVDDADAYIDRGLRRGYQDELDTMDDTAQFRLRQTLREKLEHYRDGGIIRLPNYARIGLGRKPLSL